MRMSAALVALAVLAGSPAAAAPGPCDPPDARQAMEERHAGVAARHRALVDGIDRLRAPARGPDGLPEAEVRAYVRRLREAREARVAAWRERVLHGAAVARCEAQRRQGEAR
jgi:hypothetical protein